MFAYRVIALLLLGAASLAAQAGEPLKPKTTPPDPHFNRLYHNDVIYELMAGYAKAYPDWIKLETLGKTSGGGETRLLILNNPKTGEAKSKPGFYIDGSIHANEAQGAEQTIYIIDYMLKNYGKLDRLTETMDRASFFFVPIISPDSRAKWFDEPATPNYPRTVQIPVDDDRDGEFDEDAYDDLNGDGFITQMRKKTAPGQGQFKLDPEDPRILVAVEDDEMGDYVQLGFEGLDNDGDGSVNEDNPGYIDPNRSWGYYWQPRYVQAGAYQYPLRLPETRNVAMWALDYPNLAAVQSFHNTGRMILRGPGAKSEKPYPPEDVQVYDLLGEEGEKILPGYNYWVTFEDLYTVYGGTTNHFYGIHGILSFTNELYGPEQDFDGDGNVTPQEQMKFNDLLTQGRMFIDWKPFDHPQYGPIEIGGFRYDSIRAPEGWLLEQDCHRNASFVLFHAYHLPKIGFGEPIVEKLDRSLWKVYVPVINHRAIPTMSAWARNNKLHRPDIAAIEGATVISSGIVQNRYLNNINLQEHRPERLLVQGVNGLSTRMLYFLVEGKGSIKATYDSLKGGRIAKTIELEETE